MVQATPELRLSASPTPARILIVDDDSMVADALSEFLQRAGYPTVTAADGHEAISLLRDNGNRDAAGTPIGLILADLNMPRIGGIELLRQVRRNHPSVVVIAMTGYGTIESAVEAVKLGAFDYLTKPLVDAELKAAVDKALRQQALLAENVALKHQLGGRAGLDRLVGHDRKMERVYQLIEAVAPTRTTLLVLGESGTGKTMVARAVHDMSPRREKPFVTFACGSIPETLLESELFGHVKGAFTGADADKPGKLRAAEGGTLFIDEINSATPALQLKLLRVLQEKQFEPVGSHVTHKADVRFVLATNQSLDKLVTDGLFREDLYYRINVVNVQMPALRERSGDIPALAEHFLHKYCLETGKVVTGIDEAAMESLLRYRWPGNVRELENVIERAVVLARRPIVQIDDLPDPVQYQGPGGEPGFRERRRGPWALPADWKPKPLEEAMRDPEKQIILAALRHHKWNRQKTAADLDINRTTLYKKIKDYGLEELGG